LKKAVLTVLKLLIPAGIFAYLLSNIEAGDYAAFWGQPKRWELLIAAQLVATGAILVSIFRWSVLVRAFGIPFTYRESLRLGFLGYLLNFVSFGSVGGDLFKAILVAKDKPEKRPEAIASVLLDRALGLLGLVLLACLCLFTLPKQPLSPPMLQIRNGALLLVVLAVGSLVTAIYAGAWYDRLVGWIEKLPWLGSSLARMALAVRLLRSSPRTVLTLSLFALGVHALLSLSVYLISKGVYVEHPSLSEHLLVVPPAMAAGTLPLAPGGLGYQEGALALLFEQLPDLPDSFSGALVAIIYRFLTVMIAGIGLVYYWSSHGREFRFAKAGESARLVSPSLQSEQAN
jgi:glycosyltransferase 2 family protein